MKYLVLACSLAALSAAPLSADPLTTDYTTNVTMGTTPSTTNYSGGYSVNSFSLTGTDTLNFSTYDSVTFLVSAGSGTFTYDASSTDSYVSLSLTFGTSSAGMVSTANFAITFLDESGDAVAVTYDSASVVMGSNATNPNGVCVSAEFYNVTQDFSFSSIRIDMDYAGFSGGTICSQDISLTSGSVQFWAASGSYTDLVTYAAAPEPSTYAACFGLAGLGAAFVARRRRRGSSR